MAALRNGTLKHTGRPELRAHVLNAIARRLPGGDFRFDRPISSRHKPQANDRRVIDGFTPRRWWSRFTRRRRRSRSVYEDRGLVSA